MALYLKTDKIKINLDGKLYKLNIMTTTINLDENNDRLLSSDNFILKDSQGKYLIPQEENISLIT